jgi:hypothetical protein
MTLQNSINTPGTLKTFSASIPANRANYFATFSIAGPLSFVAPASPSIGTRSTYRLIANGIDVPAIPTTFLERSDSVGLDNRNLLLNIYEFEYDGNNWWYRVTQAKGALPAMISATLTFPNRTAGIVQSGQIYSSSIAGAWTAQMVSAQTIPANKAGRITVLVDDNMLIGLNDVATVQSYPNFEYKTWVGSGLVFTDTIPASLASAGAVGNLNVYLRLTRSSNGVVTVESSPNNSTWTLQRTFGNINQGALYLAADLSADTATRQLEIIAFEIEP